MKDNKDITLSLSQTGYVLNDSELLTSYSSASIPVFFKKVFEITPIHKGYSRHNQEIGLIFGPRFDFNFLSNKTTIDRQFTMLYGQISRAVSSIEKTSGNDIINPFVAGFSLGADWEMSNGFILDFRFSRSLTSVYKKDSDLKSNINRFEIGVGYRFY
jgi:hypothetical protein